jgi:hypothetical protein
MTENLSFYEENPSNMPQQSLDILAESSWISFLQSAKEAEAIASLYDPTDDGEIKRINRIAIDLSEEFGFHHNGMRAKVVGLGYGASYIDAVTSEPTLINTADATFLGCDIRFMDGKWQAMLEFQCDNPSADAHQGTYYIPPNKHHLMALSIDVQDDDDEQMDDEEATVEFLHDDFQDLQKFVYGPDFTRATPDEQRLILDDMTRSVDSKIPRDLRDKSVVISCAKYYTMYDDMNYAAYDNPTAGFDLRDFLTDMSDMPVEERQALVGVISTFEYPELKILPPDTHLSAGTLKMNDGSYCLVLRSDKERATHYILPQTISDIY